MATTLGRYRCSDALGVQSMPMRDRRARDQEEPEVVCRITGNNGDLRAEDGEGNALLVRREGDVIEVYRSDAAADEVDPNVVGTYPGLSGDPARAAATTPTGDALRQWHRTGRSEFHMQSLAEYQRRLTAYYGH
jgi:hypothetical protein